jgi:terminal uridylyltransferase
MIPNPNGATTIVGPSNTMGSLAGLGVGVGIGVEQDAPSPLPPFAPFSPPTVPSILRPLNGEPANYISPSTLLSPNNPPKQLSASPLGAGIGAGIGIGIGATGAGAGAGTSLAAAGAGAGAGVDGLAKEFGKMGVTPPGAGNEEPSKAREEEVGRKGVGVSGNASEQEKVAEGEGGGVTSPDRQRSL